MSDHPDTMSCPDPFHAENIVWQERHQDLPSSEGERCKRCGHDWRVHYVKTEHHGYLDCGASQGMAFCDCPGFVSIRSPFQAALQRAEEAEAERDQLRAEISREATREAGEGDPDDNRIVNWRENVINTTRQLEELRLLRGKSEARSDAYREALERLVETAEIMYEADWVGADNHPTAQEATAAIDQARSVLDTKEDG